MIIKEEKHTREDADGNITVTTKETSYRKDSEPDYIKLYTKVWCEFNEIPVAYRNFFLELVQRMTYCNSENLENSQIVFTGTPVKEEIMHKVGWKSANMYQKALKKLCDCNAIKKVARSVYQINPSYAGKGAWKYNPREHQGGVKDLIAKFSFKDKLVHTEIIWADDGSDDEISKAHREGLRVKKQDETVLKYTDACVVNE